MVYDISSHIEQLYIIGVICFNSSVFKVFIVILLINKELYL
jgi:hypothetical protein